MNHRRIEPQAGQESVWDYPRPPRIEAFGEQVSIIAGGITIVDATQSYRVLETSHPPVYYIAREWIRMDLLRKSKHGSFCEWKGHAHYYSLHLPDRIIRNAAWSYEDPTDRFASITGCLAFYPSKMDSCYVDGEQVEAQPGDFYGGWITSNIVGPFKGGPSTFGW